MVRFRIIFPILAEVKLRQCQFESWKQVATATTCLQDNYKQTCVIWPLEKH